jgi:pyruvate dehydrogenase (quinone)
VAKQLVSDFILARLREWGVEHIFGFPGDGINGILGAWRRADDHPRLVQARHEEMAAFEAVGYAKFTGRLGVCMATSGPGAIHLLNGLYDAKMDHVPVLAIVGQTARTAMGSHYQQEVDLISLFKDVASEYVQMATTSEQFPLLIDRAIRIAMSERAPTCLIVPSDLQEEVYEAPAHAFKMAETSLDWSPPDQVPDDRQLRRAAEVLNEGHKVAILVGQGARDAASEVLEAADVLGACVSKALLGKDVLPDEHPLVAGPIGLLGTKPSWDLMMGCDTLLMVGTSFPYSQFLPDWGQAKAVEVNIDAKMIGIRYPTDVNLVGDARATMAKLLPLLQRKEDRAFQDEIKEGIVEWWKVIEARSQLEAEPINPELVFWELSPRLPGNVILASDSGTAANWYAREVKMKAGMRGSLSGNLATMGPGVPYAIGAKFAHPDRPVIALVGDGAMQMNGINELITISKYWKEWPDPRLVVLVLNNLDLNQVTWEMRAMEGDPKFEASQDLPPFPFADYASSLGLKGIRIDRPDQVAGAWDAALSADRPTVIQAMTSPDVPPLPPHATVDQATSMMKAVLKGDPRSKEVIKEAFKGKIQEFLPHRDS